MEEDLSIFLEGEFSSIAVINGVELKGIFEEQYASAFDSQTEGDRITFLISYYHFTVQIPPKMSSDLRDRHPPTNTHKTPRNEANSTKKNACQS